MLALECTGKPFSKTEHRNALIEAIGGSRSDGSVERKHQNISAVMLQLGLPYIRGYKPLPNIQEALRTEVRRCIETDPGWFAELQPQQLSSAEARFSAVLRRVAVPEMLPEARGRKVDYGLLQEESKRVGDCGEEFVFNFEKAALEREGRGDLAADVLWVAREIGDGAGRADSGCPAPRRGRPAAIAAARRRVRSSLLQPRSRRGAWLRASGRCGGRSDGDRPFPVVRRIRQLPV